MPWERGAHALSLVLSLSLGQRKNVIESIWVFDYQSAKDYHETFLTPGNMILTWIIGITAILLIEWMLWWMFRQKNYGLCFPHAADQSSLRFSTTRRLRIVAIAHTTFLIAVFLLATYSQW